MRYLTLAISFICVPLMSAQAADLQRTAKSCPAYIGSCALNTYIVKKGDNCQKYINQKSFFHFKSDAQIQQLNLDVKCPTMGLKAGAILCYPKKDC